MDNLLINPVEIFKALGDQNRLKILKLLSTKGNALCVGMLAQKLGISQPSVSQHLKILKNVGIIVGEKNGYHMHYKLQKTTFENLGIDIINILEHLKIETIPGTNCEYQNEKKKCDEVNE